jgi:hypothetical protein
MSAFAFSNIFAMVFAVYHNDATFAVNENIWFGEGIVI